MAELGAALIGAGMVADTHVAALHDAAGVRLRGVWSRSAARAEALGTGARIYRDLAEICADDTVDIAVVITPPDARAEIIAPLVAAGKHILVEKPLGRSVEEAQEVVTLARQAEVRLGVVFQHRMRAASLKAIEMVGSGTLGPLALVDVAVPWWRDQAYYDAPGRGTYVRDGGGVLISQAIHTLDLMLCLAGPVDEVQAMTATTALHEMEAEDFACAGLRFRSGAVGALVASTADYPGAPERIRLQFAEAALHLEAGVLRVEWRDGRTETHGAEAATGGGADPMAFTHDWHRAVIEAFCEAIRDGREPTVSGEAAVEPLRLIAAIETSSATRAMVRIPR